MIFADDLNAERSSKEDLLEMGAISLLADAVNEAQRFVLADEFVIACEQISSSKLSSLNEAAPFARLPYPMVWLEWNPRVVGSLDDDHIDGLVRPVPSRMGALLASGKDMAAWTTTFAWAHVDETGAKSVTVCPLGTVRDWREDGVPIGEIIHGGGKSISEKELALLSSSRPSLKRDAKERQALMDAARREALIPSPVCGRLVAKMMSSWPIEKARAAFDIWARDITGAPRFVESVILMLNARNGAEIESSDLTRLNRARIKRGRAPFLEHSVTRLALPRSRSARASIEETGTIGNEMRRHWVRGHFKVRKSGVFYWSPFHRGSGPNIDRHSYRVGGAPDDADVGHLRKIT